LVKGIYTVKKNTEALLVTSKEIGREVNAEKTNYLFISHQHNVEQNHNNKITNSPLKMGLSANICE
jgi:hypothetical protein